MGENIRPLESLGPSRRQSAARRARRSRAYSCRCDDYHSWTQKVLHQKSQIVREALLMPWLISVFLRLLDIHKPLALRSI